MHDQLKMISFAKQHKSSKASTQTGSKRIMRWWTSTCIINLEQTHNIIVTLDFISIKTAYQYI